MAPRRGARVVKVDHVDYDNLTVKEVLCPICRSILIEPVTLPCNHVFCSSCFQGTMENANLVCPLCRIRIGSWLRSSKKENKLINLDYWNAIKKLFPVQIKNKLNGIEENLDYEEPLIRLSEPGELKKEYDIQIQKETEIIRKEREAEAKASEDLIRKLKEEENYQKVLAEEKLRLDEEIAKKLAEELNSSEYRVKPTEVECIQSTSKVKSHTNHVKKIGPLDRFLKCKDLKKASDYTSDTSDQSKKVEFSKKEYTCRILCQDIGKTEIDLMDLNLLSKKSAADINLSNLNFLNKKINAELDRVVEVEGNSDSSDSIDSEYRYFKPVDWRRNPPCQKSTPVKVPTIRGKVIQLKISAPKGQNTLQVRPGISAFASFFTPLLGTEEMKTKIKPSKQAGTRRKSASLEKRQTSARIKSASPGKKSTETRIKSVSPEKKNNNASSTEKSNQQASSPKKDYQNRLNKIEKINSPSKRKTSDNQSSCSSPRKRSRTDLNNSFSRFLTTPSSPFRGFNLTVTNKKLPVRKTPPRNVRSSNGTTNSSQKTVQDSEKEKREMQEKTDYELARKLQNQFNSVSYSTRSSAPRKGIKVTRQTTLDNILSKKTYKV